MLRTTIQFKEVIKKMAIADMAFTCEPNEDDWEMASALESCFSLFYDITQSFSMQNFLALNHYFAMIYKVHLKLLDFLQKQLSFDCSNRDTNVCEIQKYWEQVNGLLGIAIIFGPHCK